jgi:hypothetical protein
LSMRRRWSGAGVRDGGCRRGRRVRSLDRSSSSAASMPEASRSLSSATSTSSGSPEPPASSAAGSLSPRLRASRAAGAVRSRPSRSP